MAVRVQKEKTATVQERSEETPVPVVPEQETHDELDALLDEIDEVLEVNAEAFVREYIQKGGQ